MEQLNKDQMVITILEEMVNGATYVRKTMPNMELTLNKFTPIVES